MKAARAHTQQAGGWLAPAAVPPGCRRGRTAPPGEVTLLTSPGRLCAIDWPEAQAFAFALIIGSGKPHGQVWHELRRAQGFAGRRRRVDPPFSTVLDAVASLVLSANQPGPEQRREFQVLVMLYGQAGREVRP